MRMTSTSQEDFILEERLQNMLLHGLSSLQKLQASIPPIVVRFFRSSRACWPLGLGTGWSVCTRVCVHTFTHGSAVAHENGLLRCGVQKRDTTTGCCCAMGHHHAARTKMDSAVTHKNGAGPVSMLHPPFPSDPPTEKGNFQRI